MPHAWNKNKLNFFGNEKDIFLKAKLASDDMG